MSTSNATNIERRNDNNKNNKICRICKQPGHFTKDCRAPREAKSKSLATRNTRVSKRTRKEKKTKKKVEWSEDDVSSSSVAKVAWSEDDVSCSSVAKVACSEDDVSCSSVAKVAWSEEDDVSSSSVAKKKKPKGKVAKEKKPKGKVAKKKKPKGKVAWSEEDDAHRQALIKCARAYAKAEQDVLSIPDTSVIEDIQYAISLLNEQYKAETCPDQFEPKYDLSLAESPTKEALVAGRILVEFSNLTAKLHQELNYDPYWAINESSRILAKVMGVSDDSDDLEDYDLGERDDSMEVDNK